MKGPTFICVLVFGVCLIKAFPAGHHTGQVPEQFHQLPSPIYEQVCKDLTPIHGNHAPQNSPFPYQIETDVNKIKPFDKVKVTISGIDGALFKGFMAQARNGDKVYGKFEYNDSLGFLSCFGVKDNTVTTKVHANKDDLSEVSFTWIAPAELPDHIEFVTTVVKDFATFWVLQKSEQIITVPDSAAQTTPQETKSTEAEKTESIHEVPNTKGH